MHTSKNQILNLKLFSIFDVSLSIKREDLLPFYISGNKYRKLKYNLLEAENEGFSTLLTFGGAFSNHLAAVAYAGKEFGFSTIGIVRGNELKDKVSENATLSFCESCGMKLHFISRSDFRRKEEKVFLERLKFNFGNFYLIPEGGTNNLAIRGCEEILTRMDSKFDYICTAVGTGGTIAGLVKSSSENQKVIGFSVLKGTFQSSVIKKYTAKNNYKILDAYSFGGYAKIDIDLICFINNFKEKTSISLDPIYTGKMMYGIFDLIKKGSIKKNSSILAIHTGGLQGISGMNTRLNKKNMPLINL